jgi:hypothetical protein
MLLLIQVTKSWQYNHYTLYWKNASTTFREVSLDLVSKFWFEYFHVLTVWITIVDESTRNTKHCG